MAAGNNERRLRVVLSNLMPVIPTVSGGISLLSSSLMPYRTLLTSCDDVNIYVVPLYRPHGGKNQNGLSDICVSVKPVKPLILKRDLFFNGTKVIASIQSKQTLTLQ